MALLSHLSRVKNHKSFAGATSLDSPAVIAYNGETMLWQRLAVLCPSRRALKAGVSRLILSCALILVTMFAIAGSTTAQQAPPSEKDKLVNDIVTLDSELTGTSSRLTELQARSAQLKDKIVALKAQAEAARAKLARKKKDLTMRAREMYVNGRTGGMDMLLSSEDINEFMQRMQYQERLAVGDSKMVIEINGESQKLANSLGELTASKSEIDSMAKEASAKKDRLSQAKQEKQQLLAQAGAQKQSVVAQASGVEAKMQQLNPAAAKPSPGSPAPAPAPATGKHMTMVATMYCPLEPGLDEHTASGMIATRGVIAVDPRVIPLGTRMWVSGYGNGIAGDTGSAIKGNRIDLCVDTLEECNAYGKRTVEVIILD